MIWTRGINIKNIISLRWQGEVLFWTNEWQTWKAEVDFNVALSRNAFRHVTCHSSTSPHRPNVEPSCVVHTVGSESKSIKSTRTASTILE